MLESSANPVCFAACGKRAAKMRARARFWLQLLVFDVIADLLNAEGKATVTEVGQVRGRAAADRDNDSARTSSKQIV